MADKEPRRRKKNRRDSQKKDDVRSEEHQFFLSSKTEPRDSDQDAEEEPVIHSSHQPSNVAKIVFVILFSGLVVSLSVIFISLRDVKDSSVDVLEMGHDDHHGEALHDEHIEDALHDDHDDHDEHEVSFEDILPSLSSILSLNQEPVKEIEEPPTSEEIEEAVRDIEEEVINHPAEPEIVTDQGILEEYIEDSSPPPEIVEEPLESTRYPETGTYIPYTEDESIFTTSDYSDFPSSSVAPDEADIYDAGPPTVDDMDDDDDDQDAYSMYERADITNEADFEIREQLDKIDEMLAKASNDLDNGIDDDDDDDDKNGNEEDEEDDDDEEEEGSEEEFDFWQF